MTHQSELNYKKNVFVSIYLTLSVSSLIFFLGFSTILAGRIFGFLEDDRKLAEQKEEQRYVVQFREDEKEQPKFIENQNENLKRPNQAEFLAEKSSIATSPTQSTKNDGAMFDESLSDQFDIKAGDQKQVQEEQKKQENFLSNKNSVESIFGKAEPEKKQAEESDEGDKGSSAINMFSSSKRRSGTYISDPQITLSTYEWEYAPYLKILKDRIYKYWSVPAAYHMGLIGGQTKIKFSISRDGKLTYFNTLGHYGDQVLLKSSEDVIHAVFEMPSLPDSFPDSELTLVVSLFYPKR